jgi:hypothetical protein
VSSSPHVTPPTPAIGDAPGAVCWEYDADVRAAHAGLPPWASSAPSLPPAGVSTVQAQLLAETASLREQLAAGRQREADLLAKMQEAEACVRRLGKVEEAKKAQEKRLRTVERERQEKNEELSRLHLQLRGAVDGLKKKTEELRRQTKQLGVAHEALAAQQPPPPPPSALPPLSLPPAPTTVQYPPYPPTHVPIPPPPPRVPDATETAAAAARPRPQAMAWQPKLPGSPRVRRDSLSEIQKLKEQRELEQVGRPPLTRTEDGSMGVNGERETASIKGAETDAARSGPPLRQNVSARADRGSSSLATSGLLSVCSTRRGPRHQ